MAKKPPTEKERVLEATAQLVLALTSLTDLLLSDSYSAKDRSKLHDLAGADSVLKLTDRLRRLSSETALKRFNHKDEL
jgi:hypothetical protein